MPRALPPPRTSRVPDAEDHGDKRDREQFEACRVLGHDSPPACGGAALAVAATDRRRSLPVETRTTGNIGMATRFIEPNSRSYALADIALLLSFPVPGRD